MRKALILGALAALLLPTLVLAQAQVTGSVTGQVVDQEGNPIEGAVVTFSGPAIQGERSLQTRANGRFDASLLPAGQYVVVASAPGRQAAVVEFRLGVGETVPLNITLLPGEDFAETITVTGRLSPLEQTEGGGRFDYDTDIEELPIQNRNINLMAQLSPNVSFGPNAGQAAIAGAPAFDTIVLLDGAEISDPYFGSAPIVYLEDSIQEVQVLTTGISARYGRTQGGVINAITKSGGNEFSGTLRGEFAQEDWNSKTPFGEDQSDELDETYQATLGGFVLRDRLWFFGGWYYTPDETFTITPLLGDSVQGSAEEDRFQVKLRGAVTPNHTIDVSYLDYERILANRAGLPAGEPRAVGDRQDPRTVISGVYQGILGPSTFLDVHVTEKEVSIASGGDPAKGDPFLDFNTFRVYNNHWWDITDDTVRDNQTASANLTYAFDTQSFGSHLLEGGVQWVESSTAGDNKQSSTGWNYLHLGPDEFIDSFPDNRPRFNMLPGQGLMWVATDLAAGNEVENLGFYVQDSITWQDWRFDLGIRYDRYRGTTTGVQAFDMDFDDFSPRLGVTYNLSPSWQIMGTYAKYVGRFNDSWGENASGVGSAPRRVYLYLGPALMGLTADEVSAEMRNLDNFALLSVVGDPDFPTVFLNSDVRSPFAEEFNLSVRHALPRNSGHLALTYTNRDFRQLMTGFVGLVCTDHNLSFDLPCPDGEFVTVESPGVPSATVDTTVWGNDPRANRDYQGLALVGDYRPTARLSVGGNWTWSRTRGNYEGEGTNTPASGSVLGTYERGFPLEAGAPYGFLNPHITHRATGWGTYRWNFDRWGRLSTSAIVNYRTGRVWSRTATVPRAAVPEYLGQGASYTHFFDGRGQNEFNSVWSLDFAARWALPIWQRLDAWVKVDVQNILNRDTLTSHLTTGRWVWSDSGTTTPGDDPNRQRRWAPSGNCTPADSPSTDCTAFGRITGPGNYQQPRTYLLTVGLQF